MSDNFHLNTNIKHLRTINNESQEQLGKVVNKGATAIGNWEKGIRNPDYIDLFKIAKYYNISVDDLIKKDLRLCSQIISNKNVDIILDKTKDLSEDDLERISKMIDLYTNKQ